MTMSAAISGVPTLAGLPWRALLTPAFGGAENMACDVALMDRARASGEAVLRVYSWSTPTLSFGRNQKTVGYDRASLDQSGLAVVRRPTGGRAILHHREITYSVTAPLSRNESIAGEYSWINELLLRALRILGVEAEIAGRTARAAPPDTNPCFAAASAGEITVGARKLVGSAQYREDGALLQHGSILVADDQSALAGLAGGPPAAAPATLERALGRIPEPRELLDALGAALASGGIEPATLAHDELTAATERHVAAFDDPQWTWRR